MKKCRDPLTEAEEAMVWTLLVVDDLLRFPKLHEQLSPHDSLRDQIR